MLGGALGEELVGLLVGEGLAAAEQARSRGPGGRSWSCSLRLPPSVSAASALTPAITYGSVELRRGPELTRYAATAGSSSCGAKCDAKA